MWRPRTCDLDGVARLKKDRGQRIVVKQVVTGVPSYASTVVIEYSIGVADVLKKDTSARRRDVPTSLHQAEGEAATGGCRADISAGGDGADAIGENVMPGDVSPGGNGDVARLRAESASAAIILGAIVVVL